MSRLQEPPAPPFPVICDFYFAQIGPPGSATYDGDIYPYSPLPSDKGDDYRYAWGTTPIFLAVEFFGTAHEGHEHVIAPPGVSVLEYFWDFGDGHTGYGPIVTHTYEVPDPNTAISLTVLDSLGREFSTSKALNLIIEDFGYIHQRIRGRNTETKKQYAKGSGDFALSVEGKPTYIWIARGGKQVREQTEKALSSDRASIQTHWLRTSSGDYSLTSDVATRTRGLARHTTDTSLTSDTAKQNVHRTAKATEKALSVDAPTWVYLRTFEATLKFVGRLPKNTERTLKSVLTFVSALVPKKV
jgi:hypothetical protein